MRARGWLSALACLGMLAPAACAPGGSEPPRTLVLVLVDTLRRDHLPMYGGPAHTPNLQALAARGVVRESLASFHQTSMSMGALFTGRTPSLESGDPASPLPWRPSTWCGMRRFGARGAAPGVCLPAALPILGEAMGRRGYVTVGIVANALLHDPAGFSRGFDRWVEVGRLEDDAVRTPRGRRAAAAARRRGFDAIHRALRAELEALDRRADAGDAPLFLYLHYLDVHDWLYLGRSYLDAVELMDRGIGELMGILEEHGRRQRATILVTSDHGELIADRPRALPHQPLHIGNPSFRDVLDVPFLLVGGGDVRLPGVIRSQDVYDVLLELAGAPATEAGDPEDLAPDELYVGEQHFQTYQRGRFKSMRRRGGETVLIDLEEDPGETRDVAAAQPEVLRAHRQRVAELARELAADPRRLETEAAPVDPEWTERLRSLGYVE